MFVQLRPIFCSFPLQQIATNKKCLDGSQSPTCSTRWLAVRYGWRAFLTSLQLDSLVSLTSSGSHPTTYPPIVKQINTFPPAHAAQKTYQTDLSRFIPSVSIACFTIFVGHAQIPEFPGINWNRKSCGNVQIWRERAAVRRKSHGNLKNSFGMNTHMHAKIHPYTHTHIQTHTHTHTSFFDICRGPHNHSKG